ncbi:MAG: amidohydrolase family protein [Planctomycetes bacterium]|nr:amidohydrolase family protein [Planctomycetota bacterium]
MNRAWCASAVAFVILALGRAAVADDVAVVRVNIIDVEKGTVAEGRTVLISKGRIVRVGPTTDVGVPSGTTVVDGEGKFLIPGLIDSHVHYQDPDSFGRLFVANGVLFVRDLGAYTEDILEIRDRLRRGEAMGPELITSGAILDGSPGIWPFSEICDTPEAGRAAVKKLAGLGVDQIKVYSLLDLETYRAICEEARRAGLKVVGHIPYLVSLDEALEAGHASGEHFYGLDRKVEALSGGEEPAGPPGTALLRFGERYRKVDRKALAEFLARLASAKTHWCPTLVGLDRVFHLSDPASAGDPALRYVPVHLRRFWAENSSFGSAEIAPAVLDCLAAAKAIVGDMHRAGVPLLAGTDAIVPNVVPGFSLQEELLLLQEAGLPPADVLRAATLTPARFCGVADRLGTVEEGKTASLVLLRKNPLEDAGNCASIDGVFLRDRYLDRAALDQMLADLRADVEAATPSTPPETRLEIPGPTNHVTRGHYRISSDAGWTGAEDALLAETDGGFEVRLRHAPGGDFAVASDLVVRVDRDCRFQSAEWTAHTRISFKGETSVADGMVTGRGMRGDDVVGERGVPFPEGTLVTGPSFALDGLLVRGARLAVGEERTFPALSIGWPDWRPAVRDYWLARREDMVFAIPGRGDVQVQRYEYRRKSRFCWVAGEILTDGERIVKATRQTIFGRSEAALE